MILPQSCPMCDNTPKDQTSNHTYDGKDICEICAKRLCNQCSNCELYYPNCEEGTDPHYCPNCFSLFFEDEEEGE